MRTLVGLPKEEDLNKLSTGLVRDSIGLSVLAPDGSSRRPLGRFSGSQSLRAVGQVIAMGPAPFGLRTVIALADTVFYLSTQEAYEIRSDGKDGVLRRVVRRRVPPEPVSATAKAEWERQWEERLERRRSGAPGPPQLMELAKYRTLPEVFPAHAELLVDRAGNLWVEAYRPFPTRDTLTTWMVFSPDGVILATADLPNFQIAEVGTDRVVGVWRDADEVPYVRVYRLAKRSRRPIDARSPARPLGTPDFRLR